MITRIQIKGFQSHKDTVLELSPGVNVIYGDTDSGKSAIFRALHLAITNQLPRIPDEEEKRDNYINWDYKKGQVAFIEVQFDDGSFIRKEKSPDGKTNQYCTSESKEPLKALKGKMPDDILKISRMDSSNFQSQDDLYFLLTETPGAVARKFNKLSNLEIADLLTSDLKSDLIKENSSITICDETTEKLKSEIKALGFLGVAKKELTVLTKIDSEIGEEDDFLNEIELLSAEINTVQTNLEAFTDIEKAKKELQAVRKSFDEIKDSEQDLKNVSKTIVELSETLSLLKQCQTAGTAKKELKTLVNESKQIEDERIDIQKIVLVVDQYGREAEQNSRIVKELKELKKKKKEEEERLGVCPVCKKPF